jgi:exopolysaccharide production protein ExoZ
MRLRVVRCVVQICGAVVWRMVVGAERRTEIQWLRALAAGEVVLCHSDLLTKHFSDYRLIDSAWFQLLGGIGVELFFIVSGYVICMRAPSAGTAWAFFRSRLRRLYPMYWIFTSLVVLTYGINPLWRLNNFDTGFVSFASSYLILPQWGFPILGVGWTLEHEMMFYLFVALVMLIWGMNGPAKLAVGWSLGVIGLVGCVLVVPEPGPSLWVAHVFSPYMFAFGFGWLLRCAEEMDRPARLWTLGAFAALALIAYWLGGDLGDRLVGRIALAAVVFCAFIAFRAAFESDSRLNRAGWLLGDASFSIYLSHWFVLSGLGKLMGTLQPPAFTAEAVRLFGVALSIAIGVWIFVLLERPIDRFLRRGGGSSQGAPAFPRFPSLSWQNISKRF